MPIIDFFRALFSPQAPKRPALSGLAGRYSHATAPTFSVIGVASENSQPIATSLAFVINESTTWQVAIIEPTYFVKSGIAKMFGGNDPIICADFEESVEVVQNALESHFPGIWLRCLDSAQSRLPNHILVVYNIVTDEQVEWIRQRGGKMVIDGTVPHIRGDIVVASLPGSSYIDEATRVIDLHMLT